MLLTGFSGIDLVQFLYRNFVYQSLHFFLFFSFLPFVSLSACRRIFFLKLKAIKINYVAIKMLNLIPLQLKVMTLVLVE